MSEIKKTPCCDEEGNLICLYFDVDNNYCVEDPGPLTEEEIKVGCSCFKEW